MSYSIEMKGNDDLLDVYISGAIRVEQVLGLMRYLYNDPFYRAHGKLIFEFNDVTVLEGGKDVIKVAMKHISERPFEDKSRIACITNSLRVLTLMETFKLVTEDMPYDLEVFDERSEALKWLNNV